MATDSGAILGRRYPSINAAALQQGVPPAAPSPNQVTSITPSRDARLSPSAQGGRGKGKGRRSRARRAR